jgi:hypothetical protein
MSAVAIEWQDFLALLPEPGWTRAEFETLSEPEATDVLLRRLRRLLARGFDPLEALRLAAELELPVV